MIPDELWELGWMLTRPTVSGTFYVFGNHTADTVAGVQEQYFSSGQVTVN